MLQTAYVQHLFHGHVLLPCRRPIVQEVSLRVARHSARAAYTQVIELPIKHPELFESLGVAQPKV